MVRSPSQQLPAPRLVVHLAVTVALLPCLAWGWGGSEGPPGNCSSGNDTFHAAQPGSCPASWDTGPQQSGSSNAGLAARSSEQAAGSSWEPAHTGVPAQAAQDLQQQQQQPSQGQQEQQKVWIVRFREYRQASIHHAQLSASVQGEGQQWRWVDRHNKAAAHPTDFGLVAVEQPSVVQQMQQLAWVRDLHPDKQFHGKLAWAPEGPLKGLILDSSQLFGQGPGARQLLQHGKQAGKQQDEQQQDPEVDGEEEQQAAAESVFSVSKRPGRLSTSFMMHVDGSAEQAGHHAAPGSRAEATQHVQPARQPSHTGHDRQLLHMALQARQAAGSLRSSAGQHLDLQHHHRHAGMAASDLLGDSHGSLRNSVPHSRRTRAHPGSSSRCRSGTQQERKLLARQTLTVQLGAERLYSRGFSGAHVRVGVFDTGIQEGHPHIRNLRERSNWTHQNSLSDGLGHGSFVAGVIGSQDKECPGLAPDVELHTFKVFTDDQVSFTSWFLDAFNYAMLSGMHVINLSIGGPDFLDMPFVEKVLEVTSSGILMVSAIGNDGPLYGTLNNPADQNDVIGVGGIDDFNAISSFSSRGMTTWELKLGAGRVKPDIMAFSKDVHGSKIQGGCRTLSGTSVASPVVAGAVCLLASTVPEPQRWAVLNPASMKQALVEGAERLPHLNIYEQGTGKLNLWRSMEVLQGYQPRASVVPASLDFTSHPYMWPYSKQPLYAGALPVVFNATVLNALGVTGSFLEPPQFYASDEGGELLHVSFEYSQVLWPWSGYLALFIRVRQAGRTFEGLANGLVVFTITSPPGEGEEAPRTSRVVMPLRARIIPPPPRSRRLLWDQFHSIKYPPGYIPRDNLDIKHDILDWHGDHLFTNYQGLYNALRDRGYFIEVLSTPATCFNASEYGALLVVDPEEEWYKQEVEKLAADVSQQGLSLVVFAEWYHVDSMLQMRFYDDNTRSWWSPVTGGANVPALNDLLAPYQVELGDSIIHGVVTVAGQSVHISHGADIAAAPAGSCVYSSGLSSMSSKAPDGQYAYLSVTPVGQQGGHVAVFADSNCLDSSHQVRDCYELLHLLLQRVMEGDTSKLCTATEQRREAWRKASHVPPIRRADVNFTDFSFVLQNPDLRCYSGSHCESIGTAGSCADYLNGQSRSSSMKKTLMSTTNVAIKYSGSNTTGSSPPSTAGGSGSTSSNGSGAPGGPHLIQLDGNGQRGGQGGVAGTGDGQKPSSFGGTALKLVMAICIVGFMAVLVIWQCSGRSRQGRMSARRSSLGQMP